MTQVQDGRGNGAGIGAVDGVESAAPAQRVDRRSMRVLARSIARELTAEGLDAHALLALASELLSEATARLRAGRVERS